MMRDLTVEQYHMVYPETVWISAKPTKSKVSSEFHAIIEGEE